MLIQFDIHKLKNIDVFYKNMNITQDFGSTKLYISNLNKGKANFSLFDDTYFEFVNGVPHIITQGLYRSKIIRWVKPEFKATKECGIYVCHDNIGIYLLDDGKLTYFERGGIRFIDNIKHLPGKITIKKYHLYINETLLFSGICDLKINFPLMYICSKGVWYTYDLENMKLLPDVIYQNMIYSNIGLITLNGNYRLPIKTLHSWTTSFWKNDIFFVNSCGTHAFGLPTTENYKYFIGYTKKIIFTTLLCLKHSYINKRTYLNFLSKNVFINILMPLLAFNKLNIANKTEHINYFT